MSVFEEYVHQIRKEQLKKNTVLFRKEIHTAAAQKKIANYAELHFRSKEEIEQKILTDDIFAEVFAKDPIKQNFTEKIAENLLGVAAQPTKGMSFSPGGELQKGANFRNSKTVDFIKDGVYITQKYTNGTGGGQDNQFRDVITFLEYGSKKHRVAAYVDGSYYTPKKIEQLKEHFRGNSNVQICSLKELYENRYSKNPTLYN